MINDSIIYLNDNFFIQHKYKNQIYFAFYKHSIRKKLVYQDRQDNDKVYSIGCPIPWLLQDQFHCEFECSFRQNNPHPFLSWFPNYGGDGCKTQTNKPNFYNVNFQFNYFILANFSTLISNIRRLTRHEIQK